MNFSTLALMLVTIFWGMTFPLIRISVQSLSPSQFVFYRFTLSLLVIAPFALYKIRKSLRKSLSEVTQVGMVLGAISWISYQTQTIGLQSVEAGRAAFITGTSVVIVPFLSPFFRNGTPKLIDYFSAAGALFGLYLFTDPSVKGISEGDLWILVCAFSYAVYIHMMQKWSNRGADSTVLTFFQILGLFCCSGAFFFTHPEPFLNLPMEALIGLLFCAIFATVCTTWIQSRFQGQTTPERVALIFSLEPVFAAIFGFLLLDEKMGVRSVLGCAMILASILGSEYIKSRLKEPEVALEVPISYKES